MRPDLVIRPERPADADPVRNLLDAAFPVPAGEQHSPEAVLVEALRADGDLVPSLTFVAELDGGVVGYVACSTARMREGRSLGLGPLAVRPDVQGQGVGAALMASVVATAEQRGEAALVLLGDPGYYSVFGFEPAAVHGIGAPRPWPEGHFQVLLLRAWRPEQAGAFRYARAFDRLA